MSAPSSSSVPDPCGPTIHRFAHGFTLSEGGPAVSCGCGRLVLDLVHERVVASITTNALREAEPLRLDESGVRRDERQRAADLLEEHKATLSAWPRDTEAAIEMVAFLLRLPGDTPAAAGLRGPRQDAFPVWREGDRIRNAAGEGYSDVVSDAQIMRHARASLDAGHYRDAAFEVAVLSLRQQERAA